MKSPANSRVDKPYASHKIRRPSNVINLSETTIKTQPTRTSEITNNRTNKTDKPYLAPRSRTQTQRNPGTRPKPTSPTIAHPQDVKHSRQPFKLPTSLSETTRLRSVVQMDLTKPVLRIHECCAMRKMTIVSSVRDNECRCQGTGHKTSSAKKESHLQIQEKLYMFLWSESFTELKLFRSGA